MAKRRASVESERWSTPQLAFATCESRTRTLVDLANKFAEEFKEESDRMRKEYRGQIFDVYGPREFLPRILGEKIVVGSIRPAYVDFFFDRNLRVYIATLDGKKLDPDMMVESRISDSEDMGYATFTNRHHFEKYERSEELRKIVRAILIPAIAAKTIEDKTSPIVKLVKEFFKTGHLLKTLPTEHYSYQCRYLESQTEDVDTTIQIKLKQHQTKDPCIYDYCQNFTIINPIKPRNIRKIALDGIYLNSIPTPHEYKTERSQHSP